MRQAALVVCSLVFGVSLTTAQNKISSQWKCEGKPSEEHNIAVGDHEGHAYAISKGTCTPEKGAMGDAKEQEGTYTQVADVKGEAVRNHGIFVVTLASGDKVFYNYGGTQTVKDGKFESGTNTFTLEGGTGKFDGVKGKGGCKGTGNADGSSTWKCEGTYFVGR
jgi:hypothetical protein